MVANYKNIRRKLNIAMGQLQGVSKMVDSDQYCIDISTQLLAVISALKGINTDILEAHLKGCVTDAMESQDSRDIDSQIQEITTIIKKLSK